MAEEDRAKLLKLFDTVLDEDPNVSADTIDLPLPESNTSAFRGSSASTDIKRDDGTMRTILIVCSVSVVVLVIVGIVWFGKRSATPKKPNRKTTVDDDDDTVLLDDPDDDEYDEDDEELSRIEAHQAQALRESRGSHARTAPPPARQPALMRPSDITRSATQRNSSMPPPTGLPSVPPSSDAAADISDDDPLLQTI